MVIAEVRFAMTNPRTESTKLPPIDVTVLASVCGGLSGGLYVEIDGKYYLPIGNKLEPLHFLNSRRR